MRTLSDYTDHSLRILSIGLNPSTISVEKGFYFANPRNRFWKALNKSKLINDNLIASAESHRKILKTYRIGFTDVVKKPSRMSKDLKISDYRKWSPILQAKILTYKPKICWFHGKVAAKNYLKYAENISFELKWGAQDFKLVDSIIFISPNTSSANAVYSIDDIVYWFNKLNELNRDTS